MNASIVMFKDVPVNAFCSCNSTSMENSLLKHEIKCILHCTKKLDVAIEFVLVLPTYASFLLYKFGTCICAEHLIVSKQTRLRQSTDVVLNDNYICFQLLEVLLCYVMDDEVC